MELREILDLEGRPSRGEMGEYHQAGELEADNRRGVEEGRAADAYKQRGCDHERLEDEMADEYERVKCDI